MGGDLAIEFAQLLPADSDKTGEIAGQGWRCRAVASRPALHYAPVDAERMR